MLSNDQVRVSGGGFDCSTWKVSWGLAIKRIFYQSCCTFMAETCRILTCVGVAELRREGDVVDGNVSSSGTVESHLKHHLATHTHTNKHKQNLQTASGWVAHDSGLFILGTGSVDCYIHVVVVWHILIDEIAAWAKQWHHQRLESGVRVGPASCARWKSSVGLLAPVNRNRPS